MEGTRGTSEVWVIFSFLRRAEEYVDYFIISTVYVIYSFVPMVYLIKYSTYEWKSSSRTVLSNMVVPRHMWLFNITLFKIKLNI